MPLQAKAGAWLPKPQSGVSIISTTNSTGKHIYDDTGVKGVEIDFRKTESQFYGELGVSNRLALVGSLGLQQQTFVQEGVRTVDFGMTDVRAGLRVKALEGRGMILSFEPSLIYSGQNQNFSTLDKGTFIPSLEARALVGLSREFSGVSYFTDIQAARRFGFENVPNEWRFDLTLGAKPSARLELFAQAFWVDTDVLDNAPRIALATENLKGQLSFVYHESPLIAYQVGLTKSLKGKNSILETGVQASIWQKF